MPTVFLILMTPLADQATDGSSFRQIWRYQASRRLQGERMGKQKNHRLITYLPLVFVATFLVVVVPMLLVVWLRLSGVVTSVWAGTVIGVHR